MYLIIACLGEGNGTYTPVLALENPIDREFSRLVEAFHVGKLMLPL